MSFYAAICLTNTGNVQLVGPFNVYLNNSNNVYATVTLSQITPPNCPYNLGVPDGTTSITLVDQVTNCGINSPVVCDSICELCDLDFTQYSLSSIGRLSVGNLTGSCDNTVNNYYITWYSGNTPNDVAFTTGKGTMFSNFYQFTHPLTGSSALPVPPGTYTPVVEKVELNDVIFSKNGENGTILMDFQNCFQSVGIQSYRCDNQTNTNTTYPFVNYDHNIEYSLTSNIEPEPVETVLTIDSNVNYLAWSFFGQDAPDQITLYYSGSSYSTLIGLEDFTVGSQLSSSNYNFYLFPKLSKTPYYFNKITNLTKFNINDGDKIVIRITPALNNTNWGLYFKCLPDFNCDSCFFTKENKIVLSSLATSTSCGERFIRFNVDTCDVTTAQSEDFFKYIVGLNNRIDQGNIILTNTGPTNNFPFQNRLEYNLINGVKCSCGSNLYRNPLCATSTTPTTVLKTFLPDGRGVYSITGSSIVTNTYYLSWLSFYNQYWNNTWTDTMESYYRMFGIVFPYGGSCNDNRVSTVAFFHPSSIVETGTTGSNYFFSITANTITKNINYGVCDISCDSCILNIVNTINRNSTTNLKSGISSNNTAPDTALNNTFPNGEYYSNPVFVLDSLSKGLTVISGVSRTGFILLYNFQLQTTPFSGISKTIIPSLSAITCTYIQSGITSSIANTIQRTYSKYRYTAELINPITPDLDFEIYSTDHIDYIQLGSRTLIYRYSGNTVQYIDNNYFV